ncbi:biotin--[acetyl-CoA-carboxylase] ligase [Agrococcus carbonis]|uniref:biotin--[biotin carboxyl-carrier protein] ligase n=1 Tax=Agrococcus carbonis TaxID=684552 RepID=A0A1H1M655_9MICO|nr:biotin--[acetyl-CoA-carboxylase] ligase [Agrococcus carbonis]SDR82261.1 BirA family transcriptional regulator, biotin operon repressor / biotin-[acetyl-CoA-carboxylase] ligase [Agrococcus carbonis]
MLFPGAARIAKVVELDSIASTFDAVDDRAPHLTTWATLDQRAGRGRLGREWVSPAGKCLAATVLVHTGRMPEDAVAWMPLAAGLALADALDPLVADRAGLKWPNDVLVDERKIAGILCERRKGAVAVGFGVNLTLTRDELPTDRSTSLTLEGAEGTAAVLADAVLWHMLRSLDALLPALGGEELRTAIAASLTTIGRDVRVELPDGELSGRAVGLGPAGELQVDSGDRIVDVRAGDVVHVR